MFASILAGRKRRGTRPNHACRGSSSVARKVLQSLEGVKILEKYGNNGRRITSQGQRDLDRIAAQVSLMVGGCMDRGGGWLHLRGGGQKSGL